MRCVLRYHAERMSAAEARSQKQETEIDVLRQELKDAEARTQVKLGSL